MENLSYEALQAMSEKACEKLFFQIRWPNGFVCPICGGKKAKKIATRKLWRCTTCHTHVSLKSGTVLHSSHLSIKHWLMAVALLGEDGGISAQSLRKRLGVSYETAWLLLHKIRQALRYVNGKSFSLLITTGFLLPGIQKQQKSMGGPYPMIEVGSFGGFFLTQLTLFPSKKQPHFGLSRENLYLRHKRVWFHLPDWAYVMIREAKVLLSTTYHYGCRRHMQRYLDEFSYRWNTPRHRRISELFQTLITPARRTYREFVEEPMVLVA
ncbi:MAG: transposase [Brevinematales bacterium]|nr:transposase [Brevinematales bacterium]